MEAKRACMHAHAPGSSMREVGSKKIGGVSTAVRLLSAALSRRGAVILALLLPWMCSGCGVRHKKRKQPRRAAALV